MTRRIANSQKSHGVSAGMGRSVPLSVPPKWVVHVAVASAILGHSSAGYGASTTEKVSSAPTIEDMRTMQSFARCTAHRPFVASILKTLPYSQEQHKLSIRISIGDCVRVDQFSGSIALQFKSPTLRGLLAEELYKITFSAGGGPPLRKPSSVFATPPDQSLTDADPVQRSAIKMIGVAECVATFDRAKVDGVFATAIGSPEEIVALNNLQPILGKCLEGQGTVKLNRYLIRGSLAEGAYRVAAKATGMPNA